MALDLVWGIALIAALSVSLFLATATLARRLSPQVLTGLALLVVGALLLYIRTLWYDVRLASWLPFSNLIVLANWLPLFSAALAGVAWEKTRACSWRRMSTAAALACTGLYALIYPALGSAPQCEN